MTLEIQPFPWMQRITYKIKSLKEPKKQFQRVNNKTCGESLPYGAALIQRPRFSVRPLDSRFYNYIHARCDSSRASSWYGCWWFRRVHLGPKTWDQSCLKVVPRHRWGWRGNTPTCDPSIRAPNRYSLRLWYRTARCPTASFVVFNHLFLLIYLFVLRFG